MNLDDYLKEDTLIGEPIEEKPQNETKEEIKTGGTKSIFNNFYYYFPSDVNSLKQFFIDYYNSGDSLVSITVKSVNVDSTYITIPCSCIGDSTYDFTLYVEKNNLNNLSFERININGGSYKKYLLFDKTDDCIGLNLYLFDAPENYYYSTNTMLEIIPKTNQVIDGGSSGEQIDYTEYLEEIITRLEGVEDGIQDINDNLVSIGNGSGNNNNSQVGSVSQNVISTPLRDYNLTDQIIVIELCIGLFIGLIYVLKRTVFKWK